MVLHLCAYGSTSPPWFNPAGTVLPSWIVPLFTSQNVYASALPVLRILRWRVFSDLRRLLRGGLRSFHLSPVYRRTQCIRVFNSKRHSRSGFGRAPALPHDSWVQTSSCFSRAFLEVMAPFQCFQVQGSMVEFLVDFCSIQLGESFSFSLGHVVPNSKVL